MLPPGKFSFAEPSVKQLSFDFNLISRFCHRTMKRDPRINFQQDWKMVIVSLQVLPIIVKT